MDYPGDPGIGLVGGRFTDGSPLTDTPPSRDPASWANAVTDEILEVIEGLGGLGRSEADNTQLRQAIEIGIAAGAATAVASTPTAHGQVRFDINGGTARLMPMSGGKIIIDSTSRQVPAAGVTLAPTGADGVRMIYAAWRDGAMALEVGGPRAADALGIVVDSTDSTRTLVGMAKETGGSWGSSLSWFNRRRRKFVGPVFASGTGSRTPVDLAGSALSFLAWSGDVVDGSASASTVPSTAGAAGYIKLAADGNELTASVGTSHFGGADTQSSVTVIDAFDPGVDGEHVVTLRGWVNNPGVAVTFTTKLIVEVEG